MSNARQETIDILCKIEELPILERIKVLKYEIAKIEGVYGCEDEDLIILNGHLKVYEVYADLYPEKL